MSWLFQASEYLILCLMFKALKFNNENYKEMFKSKKYVYTASYKPNHVH